MASSSSTRSNGTSRATCSRTAPRRIPYLVNKTPRIESFVREAPGLKRLTRQEQAILALIAREMTGKEIARELGITQKTVEAHRSNICRKLEIHGNNSLSRFATTGARSERPICSG